MHPALQNLNDQQKIQCLELALESCMHTLMCLPADQVLKTMIRRDLAGLIEKRNDTEAAHLKAAIDLFY